MPRGEVERIRAHAAEAFPEEACGFLLGHADLEGLRKEVAAARPAENQRADERTRRFLIPPQDLLAAEEEADRAGLAVLGFYHSHPSGSAEPSSFDLAHAWPWYAYVVVAVIGGKPGEARAWRLREDRSGFNPEEMVQI